MSRLDQIQAREGQRIPIGAEGCIVTDSHCDILIRSKKKSNYGSQIFIIIIIIILFLILMFFQPSPIDHRILQTHIDIWKHGCFSYFQNCSLDMGSPHVLLSIFSFFLTFFYKLWMLFIPLGRIFFIGRNLFVCAGEKAR